MFQLPSCNDMSNSLIHKWPKINAHTLRQTEHNKAITATVSRKHTSKWLTHTRHSVQSHTETINLLFIAPCGLLSPFAHSTLYFVLLCQCLAFCFVFPFRWTYVELHTKHSIISITSHFLCVRIQIDWNGIRCFNDLTIRSIADPRLKPNQWPYHQSHDVQWAWTNE